MGGRGTVVKIVPRGRKFPGKFPESYLLLGSQISSRISGNLDLGQAVTGPQLHCDTGRLLFYEQLFLLLSDLTFSSSVPLPPLAAPVACSLCVRQGTHTTVMQLKRRIQLGASSTQAIADGPCPKLEPDENSMWTVP